jgi:hypothetical protein
VYRARQVLKSWVFQNLVSYETLSLNFLILNGLILFCSVVVLLHVF